MGASNSDPTILIFLGVALIILALAFFLSRAFKKTIERDKRNANLNDLNGDHRDASGHATWIGINKSSGDDHIL
ncbi:MAG: hypothetical protein WBC71_00890 [Salaquimonas sp.]